MDAADMLQQVKDYQKAVHDTDIKLRQFLSDRKRYPHPLHEELIEKVRRFERIVDRFLRANKNGELEMRMDSLLYSTMIHERAWKRLFENAAHLTAEEISAAKERQKAEAAAAAKNVGKPHVTTAGAKLFDKLYQLSKTKWAQYGIDQAESKKELMMRLIPEYQKLRQNLKQGEKLGVVYDKESHKVRLRIKDG